MGKDRVLDGNRGVRRPKPEAKERTKDHPAHSETGNSGLSALQRLLGNRTAQRLVHDEAIQQQARNVAVQRLPARRQPSQPGQRPRIAPDEAAKGEALLVAPGLSSTLAAAREGEAIDGQVAPQAEEPLGGTLSQVRVHDDAQAHELTAALDTKALASGKDIYFAEGVYRPGSKAGAKVLGHELTHVAEGHTEGRIAFWGGADHEKLTLSAATQVMPQEGFLINSLTFYSKMMDLRMRRLIGVAWPGIKHYGAKAIRWVARLFGAAGPKVPQIPPEGPEHGEGGYYKNPDMEAAKAINVREQKKHLDQAVEHKKEYNRVYDAPAATTSAKLSRLASINRQIAQRLGDALHIAQDRGSHWEGTKGMGHNDPRPDDEYNCDNPAQNPKGYENAQANSLQVLQDFWARRHKR